MKILLIFTLTLFNLSIFAANYDVKMLNQNASGVMIFEPAVLKINVGVAMGTRKWLVRIAAGYLIRPVGGGSIIPQNRCSVSVFTVAVLKTGSMRTKVQFLPIFLVTV